MIKTKSPKFSRILLKLSGEALGGEGGNGICPEAVLNMAEQICEVRELGVQMVVVVGDSANEASIRFHQRLGFEATGRIREVGHKFGRWLDLVFMQRLLDAPGTQRS